MFCSKMSTAALAQENRECCPEPDWAAELASLFCLNALYTVTQAILNLANAAGSTQVDIQNELRNVCGVRAFTVAEVTAALAEGLERHLLCSYEDVNGATRYRVNRDMNIYPVNMQFYNYFKRMVWCVDCVGCGNQCCKRCVAC